VTQTIGAAGGTLSTADGAVTLTFPAGALAANTSVGIQPITNNALNGIGPAYRFTPEGTTFAQPVQLTFAYIDAMLTGSAAQVLEVATQDAQGYWWMLPNPSRDLNAKTISVGMSHFSDWSLLQGQQLLPRSATVPVSGTQDLTLVYCVEDDMLVAPQTLAGAHQYDCSSELAPPISASNWAVNGTSGGKTGLGFVSPTGGQGARYSAPSSVPTPPLLAVSADTHDPRYGKVTLIANISIAGGGYAGSVDVSAGDNGGTIGAQHVEVTWGRLDPDPLTASGGATYQATSGYFAATYGLNSVCAAQTVTESLDPSGTILEVYGPASKTPGTYRFAIATVPQTVTFMCNGQPAPILIGQDIQVPCALQGGGTGIAPTYADANTLASTGPFPVGTGASGACAPLTATWSFTPH
jgi:hypothetical protein